MSLIEKIIPVFMAAAFIVSCAAPDYERHRNSTGYKASDITKVVMLGTGTPNATPDRSGPAVAIVVNDTPYLVDCGPGVVRRAAEAAGAGIHALNVENLNHLFVTHLHSDHTAGYPDFLLTPWVLERNQNVEAFGPPGLLAMTENILRAYEQDIQIRINGLERASPVGITVNVHEYEPGKIFEDENVKVFAFPVRHGAWKHAYGFRFETPDRVVLISGDTVPCQSLVDHAKSCDILIHEVYSQSALESRPPAWQKYHKTSHTSAAELAVLAGQVRPKLLVLYHQLFWGKTDAQLLDEICAAYKGHVVSARELDVY